MRCLNIIITFFNAEAYIEKCLKSVLDQTYPNYKIILMNDCSTDTSEVKINEILKTTDKIIYIKNDKRMFQMFNLQSAIFNYCDPEDIVVFLDGDDFLSDNDVLNYINNFYINNKYLELIISKSDLNIQDNNGETCFSLLIKNNLFPYQIVRC